MCERFKKYDGLPGSVPCLKITPGANRGLVCLNDAVYSLDAVDAVWGSGVVGGVRRRLIFAGGSGLSGYVIGGQIVVD